MISSKSGEQMKRLFEGKRKLITIPVIGFLSFVFIPITLGLGLGWLVYKKVDSPKLKYSLLAVIALFTILTSSAWVTTMITSSRTELKQEQAAQVSPTPQAQTAPVETTKEPAPTQESISASTIPMNIQTAKVTRVIDGDTIDVSVNGKTERIRIIGINTPETVDPRKLVECFGEQASVAAKENLTDETVQLESDPTQGERDKYSRLLRYVWLDDGTVDFGKLMITTGYAYEYTYNLSYKYQKEYKQAQGEAEQGKKGLWADDACLAPTGKPTTAPTQSSGTTTSGSGSCKYSCNTPDRDCADFSTHAEAQVFFECCGFTATNDPMRLDSVGVGDGVACESLP